MKRNIDPASGAASAHRYNLAPSTTIFKTRFESCGWKDRAEVGPFCRKGLRSVAATCDQTCFDIKITSPEITAPFFVSACDVPLTVHLAAIWKIFSGRTDRQKSPNRIAVKLLFPYATGRRSTTGILEQMPRSWDRRASARMARSATSPLRSTPIANPRSPSALAKSKPSIFSIFQNLVFVAQLQFCLRQLQRRRSHRMAVL